MWLLSVSTLQERKLRHGEVEEAAEEPDLAVGIQLSEASAEMKHQHARRTWHPRNKGNILALASPPLSSAAARASCTILQPGHSTVPRDDM